MSGNSQQRFYFERPVFILPLIATSQARFNLLGRLAAYLKGAHIGQSCTPRNKPRYCACLYIFTGKLVAAVWNQVARTATTRSHLERRMYTNSPPSARQNPSHLDARTEAPAFA